MVPAADLKKLKIFRETAPAALERLASSMTETTVKAGATVLKEGEVSGALYLIASGVAAVQKKLDQQGRVKTVARLGEEEFFGEMSFIEKAPHSATVTAETDVKLYLLPRQALVDVIAKDPKLALEPVLTLLSGVSARLRRTTRELVTVFEISRLVSLAATVMDLAVQTIRQLREDLGDKTTIAFYTWNPFNDEYALVACEGSSPANFPATTEEGKLVFSEGELVVKKIQMLENREGLLGFTAERGTTFDPGEKQMMETVAAVLAPALATARAREEETARQRLERSRQRFSL